MAFSGSLRSFAESLAPDQDDVSRGKQAIYDISTAIQAHFRGTGTVDRITPFGSVPKKTSVQGSMDVDMIVYINNKHPPFPDVVNQLAWIVKNRLAGSKIDYENQFGVFFKYQNMKVDLLPGRNFLPLSGNRSDRVQHANALAYVKTLSPSQREVYSTSLSGASVLFEQSKDSFSHSLSRLAKYWSRKTPFSNVRSLSSVMEYLGAWAAKEESLHQDMVRGFRHLLGMIISLDSMNIFWTDFYSKSDIPREILLQRPLLLDPCNPYNNFMKLKNNEQYFRRMRRYARKTLERIDEEERNYYQGKYINWKRILSCNNIPLPAGKLRKFAESLAPKQQEMKEASQAVHQVTLALQTHFKRRRVLSRVTTFGSFRKKTSITNMMDVDMIVYMSKGYPPFHEFLDEIDDLIQSKLSVNPRRDEFGLYFTYKGTKVDLLLAKNFLPPKGCPKAIVQHEKALEYVMSLPASERDKYSTSLSGVSVGFEKQRSSFSHSLSRLAKYWSKNVPVSNLRSPSCIMEYLGAWAADKEGSSQDILSGFRYLLKMIVKLDGMCVYWTEYYSANDIPASILSNRPLLLDPCNPYNNFMTLQNNVQYFRQMRKYARETLQRIDEEERSY